MPDSNNNVFITSNVYCKSSNSSKPMAVPHCDHRNTYWPTRPACTPDAGHEPGWKLCDQEPTMGPAVGVPNHGPRTICMECWQDIYQAPPPQGLALQLRAEAITDELVYNEVQLGTVSRWDLRDSIQVRGYMNIETTQTLLRKTCTKEEVARWRLCEADPGYAAAFLADKTQWAAGGHTNTCVCVEKCVVVPHYCLDCLNGALDDRLWTAQQNRAWLHDKAYSAAGQRRLVGNHHCLIRNANNYTIPCRCGRDVARDPVAAAPQATFCLACNGTKIWADNIPPARYPVRATRRPLPDPAAPYPLQITAHNEFNDLPANLQPGAREILRSRF